MNNKSVLRDIDECIRTIQYIWIAGQGNFNQIKWPKLISLLMDINKLCREYKDLVPTVERSNELKNNASKFVEPEWWSKFRKGKKRAKKK